MKKEIVIIILSIFFLSGSSKGQQLQLVNGYSIVGKWQSNSNTISSMLYDTYKFFENNRFIFTPNAYNGLNTICELKGSFRISIDSIIFVVDTITELENYTIERSHLTTLSGSWSVEEGKLKVRKILSEPQITSVAIFFDEKLKTEVIRIGSDIYYRIFE